MFFHGEFFPLKFSPEYGFGIWGLFTCSGQSEVTGVLRKVEGGGQREQEKGLESSRCEY